jgi:hypothetical protein
MGILDEAIKEHLELKRQHGAGDSELKQLEDEAFGAAERPGGEEAASDALAEAPTAFMAQPDSGQEGTGEAGAAEAETPSRQRTEIADLQEDPRPEQEAEPEPEEPAEEEAPAMEHEAVAETEPSAGPSTEERHAIAEQPTEMYDVEEEFGESEARAPSEEELVEEEIGEARLAPVDPLAGIEEAEELDEEEEDEDDDFWDEKRLSDELDHALDAPFDSEAEGEPEAVDPATGGDDDPEVEDDLQQESPSGRDEDVLEETPDFLEETPEDDRLWFEQKPPKDFDFDD